MKVCDFCPTSAETNDNATVRRFRLKIEESQGTPMPEWAERQGWWVLDFCSSCFTKFMKDLDGLIPPANEIPKVKKGSNFEFKRVEEETKDKTPKK
jgi:hypothetical protein